MKSEDSRKLTKMTLKFEVSFLKCEKCEVRIPGRTPIIGDW